MAGKPNVEEATKTSAFQYLTAWGEHSVPPMIAATLTTAQHMKPFQPLPMMFPPVFLFTSYLNLSGYVTEAAGMNAAWSGLYILLASRRKQPFLKKWGARGIIRGSTMGLCAVNVVSGGLVYTLGRESKEGDE
ncbi:MAG: hypothetical protein M1834_002018 [Cirrosporium novae-zelandiae]|nr:MAG: hypothetical protein M1834_002018 [Cirrosporium novae-zelandiae]